MIVRVLVEGTSDVPTIREIFVRGLGQVQGSNFQIFHHRGKGKLPSNLKAKPRIQESTLLGQLPAKLRAYGRSKPDDPVLVLIDADRDNVRALHRELQESLLQIRPKPKMIMFRIAVEEIESWFISDPLAIQNAYPHANVPALRAIRPDEVVGAWEALATSLSLNPSDCTGVEKEEWAKEISPYLDLENPISPSLRRFIKGATKLSELA